MHWLFAVSQSVFYVLDSMVKLNQNRIWMWAVWLGLYTSNSTWMKLLILLISLIFFCCMFWAFQYYICSVIKLYDLAGYLWSCVLELFPLQHKTWRTWFTCLLIGSNSLTLNWLTETSITAYRIAVWHFWICFLVSKKTWDQI